MPLTKHKKLPRHKWTKHATDRVKESPIKLAWMKRLIEKAPLSSLSKRIEAWKFARYGMAATTTVYKRVSLDILFTINEKTNEVITVTVKNKQTQEVWGKDL